MFFQGMALAQFWYRFLVAILLQEIKTNEVLQCNLLYYNIFIFMYKSFSIRPTLQVPITISKLNFCLKAYLVFLHDVVFSL